jgi:hypothetical protein
VASAISDVTDVGETPSQPRTTQSYWCNAVQGNRSDTPARAEDRTDALRRVGEEDHWTIGEWRRQGSAWAPMTLLFTIECPALTSPTIPAMAYYLCEVVAADVPESASTRVDAPRLATSAGSCQVARSC